MNKQEIITVLCELNKITGFRISLHGADFREIAAYPEEPLPFCSAVNQLRDEHTRCMDCDTNACLMAIKTRATYIYKCRFGLTEAVSPLYNFGTLTGFLMMGQVAENKDEAIRAEHIMRTLIGKSQDTVGLSEKIPVVKSELIGSYVKIMTICAQYLTLSNAMPSASKSYADLAKEYIHDHISDKISISDICKKLGCSKSTLLTGFKNKYGTTVGNYITECKLRAAAELLLEGKKSINTIAAETGFSDQSYFSKVFSAHYGAPPSSWAEKESAKTN